MNKRVVDFLDEESYTTTIEPLLIFTIEPPFKPKNAKGNTSSHGKKPKK